MFDLGLDTHRLNIINRMWGVLTFGFLARAKGSLLNNAEE